MFFLLAFRLKSDKFTDITYSLTFFLLSLFALLNSSGAGWQQAAVFLMVTIWAARLGSYLLYRVIKTGRDKRFDGRRENFKAFAAFWALQAAAVWIIMLPQIFFITENTGSGILFFIAGAIVWAAGFIIETAADMQKFSFRNKSENNGKWIESGLWKYSRHPNFFGETLLWWGLFIITIPLLEGFYWLVIAGPIFITFLLLFVSGVPTVEKQSENKYGNDPYYVLYKRTTSIFIPLPRKKG
ncbi:MAG: DUF1295 domain-containing protein [Spirochaetia bacterium]|nr:DUF1295 domain-containing protein [Spirochaetia bacterium]